MMYIPPNGFIGAGQQTQAAQLIELGAPRATATRRRKRKTAKRAAPRRKRATAKRATAKRRSSKRPARLVKGSAAAKRYMASIRRKRKR